MLLHQRANLADQPINNNRRKLICVSRPLVMKQTFDRHMSVMFDQPGQSGLLTSGVFKIPGIVCKRFLSSPLPPPLFLFFFFFGSRSISRATKTENPVPRSFFSPKTNGNSCYAVCNPIQSCFPPPGKGGGEIRSPRPLYNFRCAHDTATKLHGIVYSAFSTLRHTS